MLLDEFYRICDEILPDEDGCKIWPGARHGRYPRYRIKGREKFWKASRLVLERKLGRPIKPGFLACHRCDYRNCVAEDHIYEGTHKDNMRDMLERNTDLGKAGGKALRERYLNDRDFRMQMYEIQSKIAEACKRDPSGRFTKGE